MESHETIDNAKYRRQKKVQETLSAMGFLLPNFIGFLVITLIPVFAAFLLSFTDWDGVRFTGGFAELNIKIVSPQPVAKKLSLSKGLVLNKEMSYPDYDNFNLILPMKINQDIVVPAHSKAYPAIPIQAVYQWNDIKNEQGVYLTPILKDVKEEFRSDINEKSIKLPSKINISLKNENPEVSAVVILNDPKITKEICVINHSDKPVNLKGSVLYIDTVLRKKTSVKKINWQFNLPKNVTIKEGKDSSYLINIKALKPGKMGSKLTLAGSTLQIADHPELSAKIISVKSEGIKPLTFVGFKNYTNLIFKDQRFSRYLWNTLIFLLEIPIGMAISLIMALAMNMQLKGIVAFRVMFFIPVISNIVAIALVWQWILNPDYGFLNAVLRTIGISNPPQWFSDKNWARVAIIIVDVWKGAGYNMMLYLAGLQGIPSMLYEAAEIDGANDWMKFWNITWPLLGPTNFFILIMGVIAGFQAFATQFAMTAGGPAGATTTVVYYVYMNAFRWYKMGKAAAISMILFVFVMIITAINWKLSENKVEY